MVHFRRVFVGAICSSQAMEMVAISFPPLPAPSTPTRGGPFSLREPAIWPEKAEDEPNVAQASQPENPFCPALPRSQLAPATTMC